MLFFFDFKKSKHYFPKKVPLQTNITFEIFHRSSSFRQPTQPNQTPTKNSPPPPHAPTPRRCLGWDGENMFSKTNQRPTFRPTVRRFDGLHVSGYALPPPPELDGFKSIFTGLTEKASVFFVDGGFVGCLAVVFSFWVALEGSHLVFCQNRGGWVKHKVGSF